MAILAGTPKQLLRNLISWDIRNSLKASYGKPGSERFCPKQGRTHASACFFSF
jgi:hypothetical protein